MLLYDVYPHREDKSLCFHPEQGYPPSVPYCSPVENNMLQKSRHDLAKEPREAWSCWQVYERQMSLINY